MPALTCPATGTVFVGAEIVIFGDANTDAQMNWSSECVNGAVTNSPAFASFCPATGGSCEPEAQVAINPGQSVKFTMKINPTKGTSTISVANSALKQPAVATIGSAPTETAINALTNFCCGSGAGGNVTPIPSFTSVKFGSLKFNGALLSSFSPTQYNMVDGSTTQVSASAISSTGTFSDVFHHV
jgi:hypothetical protein